MRRKSNKPSQL